MKTKILITIKILAFIIANISIVLALIEFIATFFTGNKFTWNSTIMFVVSIALYLILAAYRLYLINKKRVN